MKIETGLFLPEHGIGKVQVLQGEQLPGKAVSNGLPASGQRKLLLQPLHTSIRTYRVDRLEDNTWFCKELGRTISSTHRGKIDTERLAHEISSRKDFFQSL